jgi:photosystem II stability/assembly factor-like uncharacterized protein
LQVSIVTFNLNIVLNSIIGFLMKKLFTVLFILLFVSISYSQVFDWEWLHPNPTGNGINDAIVLPNGHYLLFGDGSTLLRSTNAGLTWDISFPDSLNGNRAIYEADFVDANIGYMCGVGGFIYKTTDGGYTWTEQISGTTQTLWYINFYDALTGYAIGGASALLKTTDGGNTWNPISLAASATLYNIFVAPNTGGTVLYLATTNATVGRVAKSTDSGATWAPVPGYTSTSSVRSLCFASADSGFIGNFAHQIFRTTDGGATFTEVSGAWGTGTMYEIKMVAPNTFAAAGNKGDVFITTDFGNTWVNRNNTYPSNVFSLSIEGNLNLDVDPLIITAGEAGSIATTTDLGITWNRLSVMETANEIRNIQFINENVGYAVGGSISTASLAGDILKTSNGGATWNKLAFDPMYRIKALYFFNENLGFVASRGPNGLYKTTNGGVTFDSINTGIGLAANNWSIIAFANANVGYMVGDAGNYGKTTDGGTTWTQILPGLHHGTSIIYDMAVIDANTVVTLGASGKVFKTTDGGTTFIDQSTLGTTSAMYGIHFLNADVGMLVGSSGRAYKTTNGGAVWNQLTTGAGTTTLYGISVVNENIAWFSGSSSSIYYTVDGGTSWTQSQKVPASGRTFYEVHTFGNDLYVAGTIGTVLKGFADPNIPVELTSFTAAVLNNSVSLTWQTATETNNRGFEIERMTAGSGWTKIGFVPGNGTTTNISTYTFSDNSLLNGIVNYRLKQIDYNGSFEYSGIVEVDLTIPIEFSLEQNYPNPFNPITNIRYSVAKQSLVTLKIYNSLGEEAAVLINEVKSPGRYNVEFNGINLSSGVYFYKLEADNFISVKKLLLLK